MSGAVAGDIIRSIYEARPIRTKKSAIAEQARGYLDHDMLGVLERFHQATSGKSANKSRRYSSIT